MEQADKIFHVLSEGEEDGSAKQTFGDSSTGHKLSQIWSVLRQYALVYNYMHFKLHNLYALCTIKIYQ